MLGVGVGVANPVFDTGESLTLKADYSPAWECSIPGYTALSNWILGGASACRPLPNPPVPAAPVIPAGSLNPAQNPAGPAGGGYYSVDQVVEDTAALQRAQSQGFFSDLAATMPSTDWSKYLVIGAAVIGALLLTRR